MCDILKTIHYAKSKPCGLKMKCLLNSAIPAGYAINLEALDTLAFKRRWELRERIQV